MIPITIEGERRLKDGTRSGNFTYTKEFARAFMDLQDRAEVTGKPICLSLMTDKAEVQHPNKILVSDIMHKVETLLDDLKRIHDEEAGSIGGTGCLPVPEYSSEDAGPGIEKE